MKKILDRDIDGVSGGGAVYTVSGISNYQYNRFLEVKEIFEESLAHPQYGQVTVYGDTETGKFGMSGAFGSFSVLGLSLEDSTMWGISVNAETNTTCGFSQTGFGEFGFSCNDGISGTVSVGEDGSVSSTSDASESSGTGDW